MSSSVPDDLACIVGAAFVLAVVSGRADARVAVVVPEDADGNAIEYRGELPEDAGGVVTFGWSYVEELVPVVVVGAKVETVCSALHPPSVDDAVDEALRRMTGLEAESAVGLLDHLVDDLPCLDKPATAAELADIFYYRAAALAFLGETAASRDSMRRAVAIDPYLEPDENLPAKINKVFAEERSARAPTVVVRLRLVEGVEVRLDGREGARELARNGLGLLQWSTSDSPRTWSSVRLSDLEDSVVVATPQGLAARLTYPDDPLLLRLAAGLGEELHDNLHVDQVVFWDGRDGKLLWDPVADETRWLGRLAGRARSGDGRGVSRPTAERGDVGSGRDHPADPVEGPDGDRPGDGRLPNLDEPTQDTHDDALPSDDTGTFPEDDWQDPFLPDLDDPPPPPDDGGRELRDPPREPDPLPQERDDRLRFTLGGGVMYLNPHPHALVGVDIGILIHGRLSLALGADVGLPITGYQRASSLPLFLTGLRLRLGPRESPVNPWLGLGFRGSLENQAGVLMGLLGASAQVGVDLVPVRHLVIRILLDGGFLEQRGQVHAKIAVGFGA